MWSGAKFIRPDGADEFREGTHDSCAEWLNSLLRAPTVREGSSTFSLQKPAQGPDCTGGFFYTPAHTS
jgi:hypothetical protein